MLDVSEHQPSGAGGRRRHVLRIALASVLALGLMGVTASIAHAEAATNAEFSCKKIVVHFTGFPNLPNNAVREDVTVDGVKHVVDRIFKFNGEEATDTIPINLTPGHHTVDLFTIWKTNGVVGRRDQPAKGGVTCGREPELAAQKLQKLETQTKFTTAPIPNAKEGNVVDYEIIVTNTGNVPLKLTNFSDPNCESLSGGAAELAPGAKTTFLCSHKLTSADHAAGIYCNTATATGEPEGEAPINAESNTVCAELPTPKGNVEFSCKSVTLVFTGFPNMPNNTVHYKVTVDKVHVAEGNFTFNGPTGTDVVSVNVPPGHHSYDVAVKWKTNGFGGNEDHSLKGGITCTPEPGLIVEKLQKIEGGSEGFTKDEISAITGQTIDYEMIVTNSGKEPLTVKFSDPNCDEGTLVGPSEPTLQPQLGSTQAEKATYTCSHKTTVEDQINGTYSNTAFASGKHESEETTAESNTVVANVHE